MQNAQIWKYDYASRCDCSDDDNCGCTSPGNMARSFIKTEAEAETEAVPAKICNHISVGSRALNFSAPAVLADGTVNESFNLFDYISGKYALLIFYAADFSAVCPLEISAFNQTCDALNGRGVQIVAISVDSVPAHMAWRKLPLESGGIGQIGFPLVSDLSKDISLKYGVLRADGMAQRATFLIDKNYTIRYQAIYDRKMERSTEETMRIVDKMIALDDASCRGLECLMRSNKTEIATQFL
ncbi:MAG: redoxin domain-containing protein [Alphaproteobacteria bacterium]|nr:redoxin domain-containing protein [Alphaproteobacteria bacterium]